VKEILGAVGERRGERELQPRLDVEPAAVVDGGEERGHDRHHALAGEVVDRPDGGDERVVAEPELRADIHLAERVGHVDVAGDLDAG